MSFRLTVAVKLRIGLHRQSQELQDLSIVETMTVLSTMATITPPPWGDRNPYPVRTPFEGYADLTGFIELVLGDGTGTIDFTTKHDFEKYRILQALGEAFVGSFEDLMSMTYEDIDELTYHEQKMVGGVLTEVKKKVPVFQRRKVQAACAYWHAEQYSKLMADPTAMVDLPQHVDYAQLRLFRVSKFSPGKLINFMDFHRLRNYELETFRKNTKPQVKDFPLFQDEATWPKQKEKFTVSLKACGLHHLIEAGYKPKNEDLHKAESSWLYKVFQDRVTNSIGKGIVAQHLSTMDCAKLWEDLCKRFDKSMAADIRISSMSTHLTSIKLADRWKGTHQSFITHFREIYRQLLDISTNAFTEDQMVMFLNQAVQGVQGLETVLTTHKTARRAAGINTPVTFEEYCQELISAAQINDQSRKYKTNPRAQRSANTHELEFLMDGDSQDEHEELDFEANVHDIDTPIEELWPEIYNTAARPSAARPPSQFGQRSKPGFNRPGNGNRRKVFLDRETWQILTDGDKKSWDGISDKGKEAIVKYGGKKTKMDKSRSVNEHEFEYDFDDSPGAQESVTDREPAEVSNAETSRTDSVLGEKKDITKKESLKPILKNGNDASKRNANSKKTRAEEAEMTINKLMSQHSKYTVRRPPGSQEAPNRNESFREINMSRGDFAPSRYADFEGEVSMARAQQVGRTDGGQSSGNSDDEGELVNDYFQQHMRHYSGESAPRREERRPIRRQNEQDLSRTSEVSRPSTADSSRFSDPRSSTSPKRKPTESLIVELKRRIDAGEEDLTLADVLAERNAQGAEEWDWKGVFGGFQDLGESETRLEDTRDTYVTHDADAYRGQLDVTNETTPPVDATLEQSVASEEDEDADDGISPIDFYASHEDQFLLDIDQLDLESGKDDETLLIMLIQMLEGRDGVIAFLQEKWPAYQKERIREYEDMIKQRELEAEQEKMRLDLERTEREQELLRKAQEAHELIQAQREELEKLRAMAVLQNVPNTSAPDPNAQARATNTATPVTPSRPQKKNTSSYAAVGANTSDEGDKKPAAKDTNRRLAFTGQRSRSDRVIGGTRDLIHFGKTIVPSGDGRSLIVEDKTKAALRELKQEGQLRTAHPANQVPEPVQNKPDEDLNATTKEGTPGTEEPSTKRTKANTPQEEVDSSKSTPPASNVSEKLEEQVQKPASSTSNSSESTTSDVQPTNLDQRLTRKTSQLPAGPVNEDMINNIQKKQADEWQRVQGRRSGKKKTSVTQARKEKKQQAAVQAALLASERKKKLDAKAASAEKKKQQQVKASGQGNTNRQGQGQGRNQRPGFQSPPGGSTSGQAAGNRSSGKGGAKQT